MPLPSLSVAKSDNGVRGPGTEGEIRMGGKLDKAQG